MKTNKRKWFSVSKRRLLLGGVVVVVIYFGFLAEYSFFRLWQLQQRKAELMEQVERSEARNKVLIERIDKLKNDDIVIEEEARQIYMAKEGETIYLTPSEDSE